MVHTTQEMENIAKKTMENLNNFDSEQTFKDDIENRMMAVIVEILKTEGPVIALSHLTLNKYSYDDMIKEMGISEEDKALLGERLIHKMFIMYIFNKVVKNEVISFKDLKVMQVNTEYLKNKVIKSEEDHAGLRVIFRLLEKKPVTN